MFSFQLVELDKHHLLQLGRGKTNRQYLREVHQGEQIGIRNELAAALHQTMTLFEKAFFGSYAPRPEDFEACWSAVPRFQTLLATHSKAPPASPPSKKRRGSPTSLIALAAGAMILSGCGTNRLNSTYGQRGGAGTGSVNGTAVLGEMFEKAGHDVQSRTSLSPSLSAADVIVWAPDDFHPPPPKVQAWFNKWLARNGKTLIYIGRDFDAAPCLLYTSPSPRDGLLSRMPSSA